MSHLTRLQALERTQLREQGQTPVLGSTALDLEMDIVRFARDVLRVDLYPRQATALKVLTAATHLLTLFDKEVLSQWSAGFEVVHDERGCRFEGSGIAPDVLERMEWCRENQRWGFRESTLVLGRRASKSFITSVFVAFQLYRLLALQNPQAALGVASRKRLVLPVISTSRERAERDQFGDVAALVAASPTLSAFVHKTTTNQITFYTPHQLACGAKERNESGLIILSALPTTAASTRGPAVVCLVLDEAAFVSGDGSTSDADAVYRAATPALSQFRQEGCTVLASSPWTQIGRFYEGYVESLELDPSTQNALQPDTIVIQLASDELYRDWERASAIPMWPHGPCFQPIHRPVFTFTEALARRQRLDPEGFSVEYLGMWAASQAAYFPDSVIRSMFAPFNGVVLQQRSGRSGDHVYVAHADPGISGSNFGFVIGHLEQVDNVDHVVVDAIHVWRPSDFADGRVDYLRVRDEIFDFIVAFRLITLSLDQFNSEMMVNELNQRVRNSRIKCSVFVKAATAAEKWNRYEKMKTLASEGRLHLPVHGDARDELRFLQRDGQRVHAPTSGPVQNDDLADSIAWVTDLLIGNDTWVSQAFSDFRAQPTDSQLLFADFGSRRQPRGYIDPAAYPRWSPDRRGL